MRERLDKLHKKLIWTSLGPSSRALLTAPRRSSAVPNEDGTLLLHTVSQYSFESHQTTMEIRVLNPGTGQSIILSTNDDDSEPTWLGDGTRVLWLREKDDGTTEFWIRDAEDLKSQ